MLAAARILGRASRSVTTAAASASSSASAATVATTPTTMRGGLQLAQQPLGLFAQCRRLYSTDGGDLPEHIVVTMPALSPTMTVGTLASWNVEVGSEVESGDSLGEVETDKAVMSFDSTEDGHVAKILIDEGSSDIPVGQPVMVICEEEGDIAAFADFVPETDAGAAAAAAAEPAPESVPEPEPEPVAAPVAAAPAAAPAPAVSAPTGDRIFVSPLARRLAAAADIALESLSGTGPNGRVTKADVEAYAANPPVVAAAAAPAAAVAGTAGADFIDEDLSGVRKVIASRLLESKQTVPHYYLEVDVCVDNVLNLRQRLNAAAGDGGYKLSVNDFVIKASAKALQKVPEVNSAWMDSFIRQYNTVDISVAVSTPNGLITPIVFDADAKGLTEISGEVKELAGRARDGGLRPEEFQGGTFTISNLGMFGVKSFSAIINPPQSCILAVGGTRTEVVPNAESESGYSQSQVMSVTASCDHRVIDGAVGAAWLKAFKGFMEDPETMLL